MAEDLLMIADRYNLAKLKMSMEDALVTKLTNENVASSLGAADMANANKLKV